MVSDTASSTGKSWLTTFSLCSFLGPLGIHRFYTGHTAIGVIQFLTFGCFGIWSTIDWFIIIAGNYKDKDGNPIKAKKGNGKIAIEIMVLYILIIFYLFWTNFSNTEGISPIVDQVVSYEDEVESFEDEVESYEGIGEVESEPPDARVEKPISNLSYEELKDLLKKKTSMQWDEYVKTLYGQRIKWRARLEEVAEAGFMTPKYIAKFDPKFIDRRLTDLGDALGIDLGSDFEMSENRYPCIEFEVSKDVAMNLEKENWYTFVGDIVEARASILLGDDVLVVKLVNVYITE